MTVAEFKYTIKIDETIRAYRQKGLIPSRVVCEYLEYIKSMLDQLDSDWVTDRPPKKSGEYIIINGEKKYDVRKYDDGWYHDMYRRYSDEELKVIAWKKIEPYERKESQDGQGTTNED